MCLTIYTYMRLLESIAVCIEAFLLVFTPKGAAVTFVTATGGAPAGSSPSASLAAAGAEGAATGDASGAVPAPKKIAKKEAWLAYTDFWSIWHVEVMQSGISVGTCDR